MEKILDTYKQKLKCLAAKLKKYKTKTQRYQHNKLFNENQQKFYRTFNPNLTSKSVPSKDDMTIYWANLWEKPTEHNYNAKWIQEIGKEMQGKQDMPKIGITPYVVMNALNAMADWKAPGKDHIHAFWWKQFTSTHSKVVQIFDDLFNTPENAPPFLTEGITFMLTKKEGTLTLRDFRPITCLPVIYKALTSIISQRYLGI